jgi:hypothetical protein
MPSPALPIVHQVADSDKEDEARDKSVEPVEEEIPVREPKKEEPGSQEEPSTAAVQPVKPVKILEEVDAKEELEPSLATKDPLDSSLVHGQSSPERSPAETTVTVHLVADGSRLTQTESERSGTVEVVKPGSSPGSSDAEIAVTVEIAPIEGSLESSTSKDKEESEKVEEVKSLVTVAPAPPATASSSQASRKRPRRGTLSLSRKKKKRPRPVASPKSDAQKIVTPQKDEEEPPVKRLRSGSVADKGKQSRSPSVDSLKVDVAVANVATLSGGRPKRVVKPSSVVKVKASPQKRAPSASPSKPQARPESPRCEKCNGVTFATENDAIHHVIKVHLGNRLVFRLVLKLSRVILVYALSYETVDQETEFEFPDSLLVWLH